MLSQMLMGFFDTWMVGQIGVPAKVVLGLRIPLDTVAQAGAGRVPLAGIVPAHIGFVAVFTLFVGTASGVATFAAQALGRGQPTESTRYAWQSFYLAILTLAVSLGAHVAAPAVFGLFAASGEVLVVELAYFQIIVWSLPLLVMTSGLRSFFQGIHRPIVPAVVGIGANVLNLGLNWLLIYGHAGLPRLGVAGAALGSVIAMAAGTAVLMACYLAPAVARIYDTRRSWRPSAARIGRLVWVGAPIGASWLLDLIGWSLMVVVIVQKVGQRLGEAHPAATNAAMSYLQLGFMPVVGVGLGMGALVGKAIGQGRVGWARRYASAGFAIGGGYQLIVGVLMIVFRRELIEFFSDDPEVIRIGSVAMIWAGLFQFSDAMGIIFGSALRAVGDTAYPMAVTAMLILGLFVPVSLVATWWVLPHVWPDLISMGPWMGGTVYVVLLGLILWYRWLGRSWERIDVFAAPRPPAA